MPAPKQPLEPDALALRPQFQGKKLAVADSKIRGLARKPQEPRYLMSQPQRFGFLPTLWFWRELQKERPNLVLTLDLLLAALMFLPFAVSVLCLPSPWAFYTYVVWECFVMISGYIAHGLFERWLRKRVVARRLERLQTGDFNLAPRSPHKLKLRLFPSDSSEQGAQIETGGEATNRSEDQPME